MALDNLRISVRILLLVIAAILMVLSVIIVVLVTNAAMAKASERLAEQRSVAELAAAMERQITTTRALILRYDSTRDPDIARSIGISLNDVEAGLNRLTGGPDGNGAVIHAIIGEAQAGFARLTELGGAIGDGNSIGLLAVMRAATRGLETELKMWPNLDMGLRLVESMRRAELEFLLDVQPAAAGMHRKAFREFEYMLSSGIVDPTTTRQLLETTDQYHRAFVAIADKLNGLHAETAALTYTIDRLSAEFVILAAGANAAMTAAAAEQQFTTSRGELTMWTLMVAFAALFILLALLIARSITRPILAIEKTIASMSGTRLAVTFPGVNRADEIGGIARTLQQAFDQLERTRDDLVAVEKQAALGSLVAGVAHEINTPIGVALTAASILSDDTGSLQSAYKRDEMTEEMFTSYMTRALQATRVVGDNLARGAQLIRSFKQVAVDSHQSDMERLAVLPYLKNALISLAHEMKTGQIDLTVDGDMAAHVMLAPTQLWQIVSNLVLNAKIHAFDGITDRKMNIRVEQDQGRVSILISDNGNGMPEEVRKRCFEPFFTTKRGSGGSGLGLSIIHSIVMGIGGRINVTSQPGQGTCFTVQLPTVP